MSGRWRDLAGPIGVGPIPTGSRNTITDVPGVRVGQAQAASGQRTGVTVVAPPEVPTPAATATVNGVGELTAKLEIDERGRMETPVYLCGSHAIGTVLQAAIVASGRGPDNIVLPVVGAFVRDHPAQIGIRPYGADVDVPVPERPRNPFRQAVAGLQRGRGPGAQRAAHAGESARRREKQHGIREGERGPAAAGRAPAAAEDLRGIAPLRQA